MTSSPTSLFVSARGIRVHYNLALPSGEELAKNQDTILLIHGFLCSTFTWHKCLQPLAEKTRCRVIAYDRLAFGLTERVTDPEQYTRKSEELLALELLTQLQITKNVHVISSSSGAVIAFDIAVARPDLIRSIIFVAPYGLVKTRHSLGPFGRFIVNTTPVQFLLKFGLTHFLPFKDGYHNPELAKDEITREGYLKPIRDDPQFLSSFALFMSHNGTSSTIDTPWEKLGVEQNILVIIGEEDKIVPKEDTLECYNILKRERPSESATELVIIPQCGHLPQEERPDELITVITRFDMLIDALSQ